MPGNAVVVDVVQHGQARLGRLVDVKLGVVGLRNLLVTRLAPRVVAPALWNAVGRLDLFARRRPEPTKHVLGLQIGTSFATLEIAQATGGPDVGHIVGLDESENEVVFLLGLERDQVGAVLAAQVTGVEPVDLAAGQRGHVAAEEEVLSAVLEFLGSCFFLLGGIKITLFFCIQMFILITE